MNLSCPTRCSAAAFTFIALSGLVTACSGGNSSAPQPTAAQKTAAVATYADIASAMYSDALTDATALRAAVNDFVSAPAIATLDAAKTAYVTSRASYQRTEFLRFDEGFVSTAPAADGGLESVDSWEGQVNAWPLDEALIDYVDGSYSGDSPDANASIVGSTSITVNGETRDTTTIDKALLISLNEIGGSEANVATGFHAVEFLLWGQDTSQAQSTPGARAATDYLTTANCTNGNCDRRGAYIQAAADLIVDDLTDMVTEWNSAATGDTLRSDLLALPVDTALQRMFFGIGSLALGETASERMRVARIANSPEDEHDCLSDTSHSSYYFNILGLQSAYTGSYTDNNGTVINGTSLSDLVAVASQSADRTTIDALDNVVTALTALRAAGDTGQTFDFLIAGNDTNRLILGSEQALISFTEALESGANALNISVNSDGGSLL